MALSIESPHTISPDEFLEAVWGIVATMFGEHGASQTNLSLISFDQQKNIAVIRTAHTALDITKAALATMTKIGNKPVVVHVLRISGTIKTLQRKTGQ